MGDRGPIAAPQNALLELQQLGQPAVEEGEWPRYLVGTAQEVKTELDAMADALGIDELVVNTITWDHAARRRSYDLLAGAYGLNAGQDLRTNEAVFA